MKQKTKISKTLMVILLIVVALTGRSQCILQSHAQINVEHIPCFKYRLSVNFDNGYYGAVQWVVDGQIAGATPLIQLDNLGPGPHTICANLIGGAFNQSENNMCCTKICTSIIVPEQIGFEKTIPYCPFRFPLGPWYIPCGDCDGNFFELYKNGVLIGNTQTGCIAYLVDAPIELRCYDVVNGIKCQRKQLLVTAQPTQTYTIQRSPEIIQLCGDQTSIVYNMNCGVDYPNYHMFGPNGFYQQGLVPQSGNILLGIGNYTIECVNYETCSKITKPIQVTYLPWNETVCNVVVESCDQLNDGSYLDFIDCDDCRNLIEKADFLPPWKPYIPEGGTAADSRYFQRIFVDNVSCKKCIIIAQIGGLTPPPDEVIIHIEPWQTCIELNPDVLPPCMQARETFHFFSTDNQEEVSTQEAGSRFTLCCNESGSNTYMIYTDDPCCTAIITIRCDGLAEVESGGGGDGMLHGQRQAPPETPNLNKSRKEVSNGLSKDLKSDFKLVPNPTPSVFRIESGKSVMKYEKVTISDMTGKVLLTKTNIDSSTYIDVSKLAKGTYFVNVRTADKSVTLKLISTND